MGTLPAMDEVVGGMNQMLCLTIALAGQQGSLLDQIRAVFGNIT